MLEGKREGVADIAGEAALLRRMLLDDAEAWLERKASRPSRWTDLFLDVVGSAAGSDSGVGTAGEEGVCREGGARPDCFALGWDKFALE